ncbi:MAG: sugar-binding domain-containing protein, partial [Bacteroidales bacterium]
MNETLQIQISLKTLLCMFKLNYPSMKIKTLIVTLLCYTASAYSEQMIGNVFNRNITSLNGKWNIIIDPYDNGYYDYRMQENPWGFFRNQKPTNKSDRVEYDFDKSETLNVPGDWNSQKPELLFYEGSIWYKRSFDCALKKGKRLLLWFGAVNYQADVYLNGYKLGSHVGGFTPFYFDITPYVKEKDNFVVVRANNQRRPEGVPTINTDWWNYGGITRDVFLIEEDSLFVLNYHLYLNNDNSHQLLGWIQLNEKVAN